MCSFGYVVVNEDFEILDEDDVVMNPETEFDWYLFDPKKDCQLAYSKDYFRMQHNFESYYVPIKKLMETANRKIMGFSVANDIGFLQSACERYDLNDINYAAYDLAAILNLLKNEKHGLEDWCDIYKISREGLRSHKSVDDAKMTMLLAKAVCEEKGITIEKLFSENKGSKISVEKYIEQRENKKHVDQVSKGIKDLFEKKIKCPYSKTFVEKHFSFGFKFDIDNVDIALETASTVYKHGGIVHKSLKSNGTIIFYDDVIDEEKIASLKKRGLEVTTVSAVLGSVRR